MLINRILTLKVIPRKVAPHSETTRHQLHTAIKLLSSISSNSSDSTDSSDSSSDSDNEQTKLKDKLSSKPTHVLNDESYNANPVEFKKSSNEKTIPEIDVAIPRKPRSQPEEKSTSQTEESKFEENFVSAAKKVAEKLGGDVQKSESELINRLLKINETSKIESESSMSFSHVLKEMKVKERKDFQQLRIQHVRAAYRKVDNIKLEYKSEPTGRVQRPSTIHNLLRSNYESQPSTTEDKKSESAQPVYRPSTMKTLLRTNFKNHPSEDEQPEPAERTKSPSTIHNLLRSNYETQPSTTEDEQSEPAERINRPSTIRNLLRSNYETQPSTTEDEQSEPAERINRPSTLRNLLRSNSEIQPSTTEDEQSESAEQLNRHSTMRNLRSRSSVPKIDADDDRTSVFNAPVLNTLNLKIPTEPQFNDLSTWSHLEQRELKISNYHPPQNYFQEMIHWTEEGKVWIFPINNEQGMEEEENVDFSEHVFMERHLKNWCPKHGPVRHFMELVCIGLSKNAFMTVSEKVDHIMWYKDYFGDKRELLQELGALDNEHESVLPVPTKPIYLGPEIETKIKSPELLSK